ncbi:MAG: YraN family protein [Prevotella sp.]|nr:YraN family protein [Prevotella sp.]
MAAHNELGKWGEEVAAAYLAEKGYVILHRDWKSGHRDLDIVARDGRQIVFVEVKTRRSNYFGEPLEAVDYRKQMNLRRAMNHYLKFYRINDEARFDIVSVVGTMEAGPQIEHIVDVPL